MADRTRNASEAAPDGAVPFEAGLERLEALVAQLESGELSLEAALGAYEAGMGLVRALNTQLSAAEARIEILTRGADGVPQTRLAEEDEL